MLEHVFLFFLYSSYFFLVGTTVVSIRKYNVLPEYLKIFTWYFVLLSMNYIFSEFFLRRMGFSNVICVYSYALIELIIFSLMFQNLFKNSGPKYRKYIIPIVCIALSFVILYEGYVYLLKGVSGMNGKSMVNLWLMVLSGLFIVHDLHRSDFGVKHPFRNLNIIILIYFSNTLILFLLLKQLMDINLSVYFIVWSINNFLTIILYSASIKHFLK